MDDDVVMTIFHASTHKGEILVFLQSDLGQLNPLVIYLTDLWPTSVAIGDVNHDCRADVVVGNNAGTIQVLLQNASGNLDPGISSNFQFV